MEFSSLFQGLPPEIFEKISTGTLADEIEKGGGTRRFFRMRWESVPAVLCIYDDSKAENFFYADIAKFFRKIGVPAPEVFFHDPVARVLVMQDLGETDLWTLKERNDTNTKNAYRSALAGIAKLHLRGLAEMGDLKIMRDGFNADYYKWERNYFLTNAAKDGHKICITGSAIFDLERELSALAERLLALPQQLVHRDFQSQNILWNGGNAHFIDFQGMRVGTGFYDVASLLFDPYVKFDDAERAELFDFYCGEIGIPATERAAAEKSFYEATAQRLMQAIGAYFFLSAKMGKTRFREFALPALESLKLVSKRAGTLPWLSMLATELCARERRFRALRG